MQTMHNLPQSEFGTTRTIGNTPLLRTTALSTGKCELYLKLENRNPGGSIKDRVGLAMIRDAELQGILSPGAHLIEGTSGNTGIGLALAAAWRGYRITLVIPDRISPLKIAHCRALGAEIVLTRSDVRWGHPDHFQSKAESLARSIPNAIHLNQFSNPANFRAHEEGTGPELYRDLQGRIDAVVCGVGSGGTLTGLSNFLARVSPSTEIVLADPCGSIIDQVRTGSASPQFERYLVEGVGSDFIPPLLDLSRVSSSYRIPDSESLETCRTLLAREGILAGTSTGVLLRAALLYCQAQNQKKRVVTFVCDTGDKYFDKIFGNTTLPTISERKEECAFGPPP